MTSRVSRLGHLHFFDAVGDVLDRDAAVLDVEAVGDV